jgi:hypothetical protein
LIVLYTFQEYKASERRMQAFTTKYTDKIQGVVADGDMEIGMGLHGEPGVERVKLKSAKELVRRILGDMPQLSNSEAAGFGQRPMRCTFGGIVHRVSRGSCCAGPPRR